MGDTARWHPRTASTIYAAVMALIGHLIKIARSPQGRRLIVEAQKAARDPKNRERIERVRDQLAKRRT